MTEVRTTSSTGGQKGVKSQRFDLIPIGPLTELAEHYGRGAKKYESHQWRQGYEWSKSYSAGQRHWTAFWDGEDYDVCPPTKEGCAFVTEAGEPFVTDVPNTCYNHTGSHHLVAAVWHGFALLEFKDTHPQHDDRYKSQDTFLNEEPLCGVFNALLQTTCAKPVNHANLGGDDAEAHSSDMGTWLSSSPMTNMCGHVGPKGMLCIRSVGHEHNRIFANYPYHAHAGNFWDNEGNPKGNPR